MEDKTPYRFIQELEVLMRECGRLASQQRQRHDPQQPSRTLSCPPSLANQVPVSNTELEAAKRFDADMAPFRENELLQHETQILIIRIGNEPNHMDVSVHKRLIRKSSVFFDNALRDELLVSNHHIIKFPTSSITPFQLYVQWLYTDRIHTACGSGPMGLPVYIRDSGKEESSLRQCYELGETLQDDDFKDSVMDVMLHWIDKYPEDVGTLVANSAAMIYATTKEDSALRKLLVALIVWKLDYDFWCRYEDGLPEDLVRSAALGLTKRFQSPFELHSPFEDEFSCGHFHCHGNQTCCRTRRGT